ncbi:dynamin family protein [Halalkalibacter urbisdiaboli]|uniref:dynamin family protein n=1 Tax=Halalkalibacter urbisdiaboli TaxID=1960589 RepID=UPI000B4377AF|nr:dynamin family protein [Halalkalibacter urbisdiaboli]
MSSLVESKYLSGEATLTESELERQNVVKRKQGDSTFQVAFCGHFSAGKSTILNRLLGAEVLPTSPIPTSANIIGIKNGELGLSVVKRDGKANEWQGEIPWQRVREWGMNGVDISEMTIHAPLAFLGDQSVIYDTPGVDSTDPSHQAVTLEALYTTDVIVYVMDYNHVQSETNLYFLKQLSDENKPLYIIINQIDKHDENELSFEAFDESIRHGFSRWGIQFMKLYYTSMKAEEHHLNKFAEFEREMKAVLYHGEQLLPYSKQRLQQSFYLSVAARLEEEKEEATEFIVEDMHEKGFKRSQLEQAQAVREAYDRNKLAQHTLETSLQKEWNDIVQNVTLFPYTTTELARNWLESIQPGFKVGILFSKKKTEEEQNRRLEKLVKETQDKVKSQLEFHFQRSFQLERELLTNRDEVERAIANVHVTITSDFFKNAVVAGHMNRDYVFTFTKERTAEVVRQLKQKAMTALEVICQGMQTHWSEERIQLEKKLEELQQVDYFVQKIAETEERFNKSIAYYHQQAKQFQDEGAYEQALISAAQKPFPKLDAGNQFDQVSLPTDSVIDTDWAQEVEHGQGDFDDEQTKQWLASLDDALQTFKEKQWLNREREQLLERVKRNKEQTFMISLFGAFSAGKSSFANALLGEAVLPVSPHPTTATVNTVKKAEPEHPHNTAIVKVKSKEVLASEIVAVAKQLDEEVTIDTIQKWKPVMKQYVTSWQKTYAEYLVTLKESLSTTTWELGAKREVNRNELAELVAKEKYACLINDVTLYYDSPLTKQGIVLVDTPGVNSIHGRHTNVAFKQLRESDAIFYVTYYNHAFSKADQHFLQQMAKVNESFRHDKLYFVLNAADLAGSEQELNGVRKHVYDQLRANGIDQPRIYHLSSKQGLLEKQTGLEKTSWFKQFEQAFYKQTIHELKRLGFDLLKQEASRYMLKLEEAIHFLQSAEKEKEEKRSHIKNNVEKWASKISDQQLTAVVHDSQQEVSQLYLFLRERIRYVLNDGFIDAINVTTVKGASKKAQQQSLEAAIKDWRGEGEHFLEQELHATLIRIEAAIKQAIDTWLKEIEQAIRKDFASFSIVYEPQPFTLEKPFYERLIDLDSKPYLTYFKSLKAFFEEGDAKRLKERIVEDVSEQTKNVLLELEEKTKAAVNDIITELEQDSKKQISLSLHREIDRFDALLDSKEQVKMEQELRLVQSLI